MFKNLPRGGILFDKMQEIVVILGYKKIIIGDNTMTKEIWRDIDGYEGLYEVSDQGRVKSLEKKVKHWRGGERIQKERILKPATAYNGYLLVPLYAGGKRKMFFVHRLVCQAFHENPENKLEVNHINEIKTDNRAVNLEWSTRRENVNYGSRNERAAKTKSKPVGQWTKEGELVKIWPSTIEVQKQTGFSQGSISKVANGKRKQAYGFIWKYVS